MGTDGRINTMEHMSWQLQEMVDQARQELASRLEDLARRAAEDAERVKAGGRPMYSAGYFATQGGEIATLGTELECAATILRRFTHMAKDLVAEMRARASDLSREGRNAVEHEARVVEAAYLGGIFGVDERKVK